MTAPALAFAKGEATTDCALTRLFAATSDVQRAVETDTELMADRVTWLDYRLYLFRMYGLHAPIERALGTTRGLTTVVEDAPLRNHKMALLAHDLIALGVDRRDLAELPRMPVPALHELPEALGWMYVLESWTLGGARLRAHLHKHLPLEIGSASAYLDCYGDEAHARWREVGSAVDRYAARSGTGTIDHIVAAASDCLHRVQRWFRPSRYGR